MHQPIKFFRPFRWTLLSWKCWNHTSPEKLNECLGYWRKMYSGPPAQDEKWTKVCGARRESPCRASAMPHVHTRWTHTCPSVVSYPFLSAGVNFFCQACAVKVDVEKDSQNFCAWIPPFKFEAVLSLELHPEWSEVKATFCLIQPIIQESRNYAASAQNERHKRHARPGALQRTDSLFWEGCCQDRLFVATHLLFVHLAEGTCV